MTKETSNQQMINSFLWVFLIAESLGLAAGILVYEATEDKLAALVCAGIGYMLGAGGATAVRGSM
jgi:hypothetical protein